MKASFEAKRLRKGCLSRACSGAQLWPGVTKSGQTREPGVKPETGRDASGSTGRSGLSTVGRKRDLDGPPERRRISIPRSMSKR